MPSPIVTAPNGENATSGKKLNLVATADLTAAATGCQWIVLGVDASFSGTVAPRYVELVQTPGAGEVVLWSGYTDANGRVNKDWRDAPIPGGLQKQIVARAEASGDAAIYGVVNVYGFERRIRLRT